MTRELTELLLEVHSYDSQLYSRLFDEFETLEQHISELEKSTIPFVTMVQNQELIDRIKQIEEPKTCEGCKYNRFGCDSLGHAVDCTLDYKACQRACYDYYEPKE